MTDHVSEPLYTAVAHVDAGREGSAVFDDADVRLELGKPPTGRGQGDRSKLNPEQLFAAGYAACFHSALLHHARAHDVDTTGSEVVGRVGIGMVEGGGMGLTVELRIELPGADPQAADRAVAAAHESCPYSRAVAGNVEVTLEVRT